MDPSRCAGYDSPSGPRRNSLLRFMHAKLSSTEKWSAMCTLANRVDVKSDGSVVGRHFHGAH